MTLKITKNTTLNAVNQLFSEKYPYLKLRLVSTSTPKQEKPSDERILLKEAEPLMMEGKIIVKGKMKVSELESKFNTLSLLKVEVLRRAGNIWLETTTTDDWTLDQQNEHGEEVTRFTAFSETPEGDFDLSRNED